MQLTMVITQNNLENTKSEEVVKIVIKMLIMVGKKKNGCRQGGSRILHT